MSYRAIITGPCEHDGMAFELHLAENGSTGWPETMPLLNAGGKEIVYDLLEVEPVPFHIGGHPNIMLTARYGPKPDPS